MKHIFGPIIILIVLGALVIFFNLFMRKRGYQIPGKTAVRCSKGHLFETLWIEGGSFKAVRLGPFSRYQYCPVGKHWAIIHPVKRADLSGEEKKET